MISSSRSRQRLSRFWQRASCCRSTVAAVGSNGAGCLLTYQPCDDGLVPEFHYLRQGDMIAPVNMILVDSRGEAARVVFHAGVDTQLLIN